MRLFFEASYYDGQLDLNSEIYNALTDIAFEFSRKGFTTEEIKAAFDRGLEWFDLHFWEDEDLDESLKEANVKNKEVDLLKDKKTIAYNLHDDDIYAQMEDALVQAQTRAISFEQAKNKMIQLVNGLEAVNDKQKKAAEFKIRQARNLNHLMTTMATYLTGQKVLSDRQRG